MLHPTDKAPGLGYDRYRCSHGNNNPTATATRAMSTNQPDGGPGRRTSLATGKGSGPSQNGWVTTRQADSVGSWN